MAGTITLKIQSGKLAGKTIVLTERCRYTLGRADECELRLPADPELLGISRYHCLLEVNPPEVRVRDLRSHNGTRINGMQIGHPAAWPKLRRDDSTPLPAYDLHDGDQLEVGGTRFEVAVNRSPDPTPRSPGRA